MQTVTPVENPSSNVNETIAGIRAFARSLPTLSKAKISKS